jgi:hypothetical protein
MFDVADRPMRPTDERYDVGRRVAPDFVLNGSSVVCARSAFDVGDARVA